LHLLSTVGAGLRRAGGRGRRRHRLQPPLEPLLVPEPIDEPSDYDESHDGEDPNQHGVEALRKPEQQAGSEQQSANAAETPTSVLHSDRPFVHTLAGCYRGLEGVATARRALPPSRRRTRILYRFVGSKGKAFAASASPSPRDDVADHLAWGRGETEDRPGACHGFRKRQLAADTAPATINAGSCGANASRDNLVVGAVPLLLQGDKVATVSPIERQYIHAFGEAAKMAAILELRIRMLADKLPETRPKALAHRLEDAEDSIIAHFAASLSTADVATLQAARRVRNKLLHCEFWTAEKRLLSAERRVVRPEVVALALDTGQEWDLDQLTTAEGEPRLFAWVLNGMAPGGLFGTAEQTFIEAVNIIIRLLDET
jgi:hypothetical protein